MLLTVREAGAELKLRPARIYSLIRSGVIPAVRFGRQVRVAEADLRGFVEAGGRRFGILDDAGCHRLLRLLEEAVALSDGFKGNVSALSRPLSQAIDLVQAALNEKLVHARHDRRVP